MSTKQKLVILDLDDTILGFIPFFVSEFNKINNTHMIQADLTQFDFMSLKFKDCKGNQIEGKLLQEFFLDQEKKGIYLKLKVLKNIKKALRLFKLLNYKVVIITARNKKFDMQTRHNLLINNIDLSEIYYTNNKVRVINRLSRLYDVKVFADDRLSTVTKVKEGCTVDKVYLINKCHNKGMEVVKGIKRVASIYDIVRDLD